MHGSSGCMHFRLQQVISYEEDEPEAIEEEDESDDEVEVEERKTFRVKANGEEKDVTLTELVEGYQKGSDYTKKSQALAEDRKKVEAEAHAVNEAMQMREQYARRLGQVQQLLQEDNGQFANLEELKENDPIQYAIPWISTSSRSFFKLSTKPSFKTSHTEYV